MEEIEYIDEKGRKYRALKNGEAIIIKGPPDELIDMLGIPEPTGTILHNALYNRRILTYEDAVKKPNDILGAIQEAMMLDTQRLMEAFFKIEKQ